MKMIIVHVQREQEGREEGCGCEGTKGVDTMACQK